MKTTVTGLFDRYEDAEAAVSALEQSGIASGDISIVGHRDERTSPEAQRTNAAEDAGTGAGIGAAVGGIGGLLTGLGIMAIPGVGPVVAAGRLAATAAGAVAGAVAGGAAGGIVGAMTAEGVPEADAHVYAEGVRRGGTLVTARVEEEHRANASAIIARYKSVDINDRRTDYQKEGWMRFDEATSPSLGDDIRDPTNRPIL